MNNNMGQDPADIYDMISKILNASSQYDAKTIANNAAPNLTPIELCDVVIILEKEKHQKRIKPLYTSNDEAMRNIEEALDILKKWGMRP